MSTETRYGEDFRSIGQALEAKHIRAFELKRLGDWYILQGVPPENGSLQSKTHKFKFRFRSGSDTESLILALSQIKTDPVLLGAPYLGHNEEVQKRRKSK